MLLVLTGPSEAGPVTFSAAGTHVCEAGVLLGAAFMGEKLLLFGQTLDAIEARRGNKSVLEGDKWEG